MRYSITFRQADYDALTSALFPSRNERAAYLLCGLSVGLEETKLLVREVIPIPDGDVRSASPVDISIPATTYVRWLKRASAAKACLVFVHSHPPDHPEFSDQDDREEAAFFETAYTRIGRGVLGSLVLSDPHHVSGRVWLQDGSVKRMECIRLMGESFRFIREYADLDPQVAFYDRQIRAFGQGFQPVLRGLRVGIVGLGGTGSSVCEQLIRLGVGTLTLIDGEAFDSSNINRVYGSYQTDAGLNKTGIAHRSANVIGLGTRIIQVEKPITFQSAIAYLKDCDVVFGCTDDQWGRSLLTTFAVYYLTPVIDMAVAVDSSQGLVDRVEGRVTILMPGNACLYCRGRITADSVRDETIQQLDTAQAQRLREEGYLIGIQERAPSVIPFTTAIAAAAVSEFLHKLTGFMGGDRTTTEVIYRMDWSRVRTNSLQAKGNCFCADHAFWGKGDTRPLLGVIWRPEL